MPRPIRMEFPGARYHVINRGNYRQDLFTLHRSGEAFEQTLFETCERFGWKLHAYVLMSNHYHLCVETPEGNLGLGMQWLQSVFANRFNKFVHTPGHVFQGRYKALLISGGASLLRVVNYIHLNPVRAGIVSVKQLREYKLASYPRLFTDTPTPLCLQSKTWLSALHIKSGLVGMLRYEKHLASCEENDPRQYETLRKELMTGWFIGTREARRKLVERIDSGDDGIQVCKVAIRSKRFLHDSETAERLVLRELKKIRKTEQNLIEARKCPPWKVKLAYAVKSQTSVTNRWLGERLHMGTVTTVSNALVAYKKELHPETASIG